VLSINGNLDNIEHEFLKLGHGWWKRIETALTRPVQQQLSHFSVLDEKEIWVKFNKGVVIKSESRNRYKTFMSRWNMQNII
jgi:hypothetical protein